MYLYKYCFSVIFCLTFAFTVGEKNSNVFDQIIVYTSTLKMNAKPKCI